MIQLSASCLASGNAHAHNSYTLNSQRKAFCSFLNLKATLYTGYRTSLRVATGREQRDAVNELCMSNVANKPDGGKIMHAALD